MLKKGLKGGRDAPSDPETPSPKPTTQKREEKPHSLSHWMTPQPILQGARTGRGQGFFFFTFLKQQHFVFIRSSHGNVTQSS